MGRSSKKDLLALLQSESVEVVQPKEELTELAVLYFKDKKEYWVRGYYEATKEMVSKVARHGWVWIYSICRSDNPIFKGLKSRPVQIKLEEVEVIQPGKRYYTFAEVFGSLDKPGGIILDVSLEDDEQEDLTLGIDHKQNE